MVGASQRGGAVQNSDERHHDGVTAPVLALPDELAGIGEGLDNGRLVLPVGIRRCGEQAAPANGHRRRTGHIERRRRGRRPGAGRTRHASDGGVGRLPLRREQAAREAHGERIEPPAAAGATSAGAGWAAPPARRPSCRR